MKAECQRSSVLSADGSAAPTMTTHRMVAVLSAALSIVSWTYRFVDEYSRFEELPVYVLVPAACWALFIGPVFALRSQRRFVKVVAVILLIPFSLLWALSVFVGFYGLKIH